jgi:hypothetical protein
MRTKLSLLVGFLSIVMTIFARSAEIGDRADEKKEGKSAAEIEKLVKDLGSDVFATRNAAFKALGENPRALPALRRHSKDGDQERQARLAKLIDELTKEQLRKTLAGLAALKHEAPIDLLTEVLARNGERMDDMEFKAALTVVSEIRNQVLKGEKAENTSPPGLEKLALVTPDRVPPELQRMRIYKGVRATGAQIPQGRSTLISCAIVKVGPLELIDAASISRSILLATGNISCSSAQGCLLFSDEEIRTEFVTASLLIARGRIKARNAASCVSVENAALSPKIRLFSMKLIGLTVVEGKGSLRVQSVTAGSSAARCGFQADDVIILKDQTVQQFERAAREAFAKQDELHVTIRRDGELRILAMWYWG